MKRKEKPWRTGVDRFAAHHTLGRASELARHVLELREKIRNQLNLRAASLSRPPPPRQAKFRGWQPVHCGRIPPKKLRSGGIDVCFLRLLDAMTATFHLKGADPRFSAVVYADWIALNGGFAETTRATALPSQPALQEAHQAWRNQIESSERLLQRASSGRRSSGRRSSAPRGHSDLHLTSYVINQVEEQDDFAD